MKSKSLLIMQWQQNSWHLPAIKLLFTEKWYSTEQFWTKKMSGVLYLPK